MSRTREKKGSAVWYALRRTLPPWRFEENLAEVVRELPRCGVDELIVKVDTEEFNHGQPPYEWVKAYQKSLFRTSEAMAKLGIVFSINPWITLCHSDRGRDSRKHLPGLRTMVGHDGAECKTCACPLSEVWRENTACVWRLYAETKPHVIWVEDDIRTFNHQPVKFGCFCPEHMKRFSKRIGRKVTREELVAAILRSGKPHPWRRKFLDVQAEIMIDTVGFLARTVHSVSPETCMGLMSSGPHTHALEGRRWKEFAEALADGRPLYSRPPLGSYSETSLRGLYYSQHSIKLTRDRLPAGTIAVTEVENVPFTQYSKSHLFTFLQMAVSSAYGARGATMNLYDHCGTPMALDAGMGRMLAEKKPFLNALAKRCGTDGAYRGVRLLFDEKASYHKRLPKGAEYAALRGNGTEWMGALEEHGIPTTYDSSSVTAVSGQVLRGIPDGEIRELLSGGLLLDAVAAGVLVERGFAREIGLKNISAPRNIDEFGPPGPEEFFNPKFGGAEKTFITTRLSGAHGRPHVAVMGPARGAEVISRIVDPDARPCYPCMTAFENRLGGRVVVHAFDLEDMFCLAYCHPFRARQLQGVVRWLARGKPPLMVRVRGGAHPLAFRKDCGDYTVLGFFNLTLDAWDSVELELAERRMPRRLERLAPAGRWRPDKALSAKRSRGCLIVRCEKPVTHDQPLFITLRYA